MPQPPQWSNEREPTLAANGTLPESLAAPGCSDPWPAGHTGKERKKERGGRTRTGKKTRQNKAGGQAWHRHTPWISAGERASRPTQRQQRRRTTPRAAALGRPTKSSLYKQANGTTPQTCLLLQSRDPNPKLCGYNHPRPGHRSATRQGSDKHPLCRSPRRNRHSCAGRRVSAVPVSRSHGPQGASP